MNLICSFEVVVLENQYGLIHYCLLVETPIKRNRSGKATLNRSKDTAHTKRHYNSQMYHLLRKQNSSDDHKVPSALCTLIHPWHLERPAADYITDLKTLKNPQFTLEKLLNYK